ncbi:MAG: pseudouridine synthase [Defluviimonas sp.]|nr:pseudouridine synthase [Defluviimonas sp.]
MTSDSPKPEASEAERIAKLMARVGIASRREAEKMILAGRVAVNGKVIDSPALDVRPQDRVTLDGRPIDEKQPTRLWLYYKPLGLVTTERDEKGRQTVFDTMPEGMPRVMSVGRLDLNSEGLLLLTNDGDLKRALELPETGWLRKYRVRVNGQPNNATFDPLRRGLTIEGDAFLPMEVELDRQQGANAWLTVGIREGKNREIRRAMSAVGLIVNRLIRVSYGPFRLNDMKPGDVIEVKARVMRDQLGPLLPGAAAREEAKAAARSDARGGARGGGGRAGGGGRPARISREGGDERRHGDRPRFGTKPREAAEGGERRSFAGKPGPGKPRDGGDRPRSFGGKRAHGAKPRAEGGGARRTQGDTPAHAGKPRAEGGERRSFGDKPAHGAKPRAGGDRPRSQGDKSAHAGKPRAGGGGKPAQERGPRTEAAGGRPRSFGGKPGGGASGKPGGSGGKPRGAGGAPKGPRAR